jgi:hypothetical protein
VAVGLDHVARVFIALAPRRRSARDEYSERRSDEGSSEQAE